MGSRYFKELSGNVMLNFTVQWTQTFEMSSLAKQAILGPNIENYSDKLSCLYKVASGNSFCQDWRLISQNNKETSAAKIFRNILGSYIYVHFQRIVAC